MRSLFSGIHVIVLGKQLKLVSDQENFRGGGGNSMLGRKPEEKDCIQEVKDNVEWGGWDLIWAQAC